MAFDTDHVLYIAANHADEISRLDRRGSLMTPLPLGGPAFPTNVAFAGPDRTALIVTAPKGGRVLALDGLATGLRLPFS
jgi:gluconolactonase